MQVPLSNSKVSIGDRFSPVGAPRTIYTVDSFVERPGLPLHVRLVQSQDRQGAHLLMSISALRDPRFFTRVAEQ
jgi:hypothetical protein